MPWFWQLPMRMEYHQQEWIVKKFFRKSFIFYTNSLSRKGTQISLNPNVALLFIGHLLKASEIEGQAVMISVEESDKYFLFQA